MPAWLVVVDVAPAAARVRVDGALRDLGFEEVLPCVYADMWTAPRRADLLRAIRLARRGAVGRILVSRLGARDPLAWIPERR